MSAGSAVTIPAGGRGVADWPSHFGAMGRVYEQRAFSGTALAKQGDRELQIVLSSLGEGKGRRLLDIGAGTGRFTCALIDAGWDVTALDGATEMLECIADRAPGATLVHGRLGEPFAFDDRAFDAVVAMRVVKYVPATADALREMTRVVRPGGRMLFDVANRASFARFGYADSPMGFVTPGSIRRIAVEGGLEILATHDGFRLPHAVVGRATSPLAGRVVETVERGLAAVAGRGSGRGARSIIIEARRANH
jgi:SAM-dependent methyltransferase